MAHAYADVANRPVVSEVQHLRGKLANACRRGDDAHITEVRRDLATAKIAQYVSRTLAEVPPLTDEQRERLASLLSGAA